MKPSAYAFRATGSPESYEVATMIEEPMLINDILRLPIRVVSTAEADGLVSWVPAHRPSLLYYSVGQRTPEKD